MWLHLIFSILKTQTRYVIDNENMPSYVFTFELLRLIEESLVQIIIFHFLNEVNKKMYVNTY